MIVVRIELHSANTGKVSEIGRMNIANTGGGTAARGDYVVNVFRKGSSVVLRRGHVFDYPRQSYNVWRLVCRALKSAFPEEA